MLVRWPVLPFEPEYRTGHPENYLFLLSKNTFTGSKHAKNKIFFFLKKSSPSLTVAMTILAVMIQAVTKTDDARTIALNNVATTRIQSTSCQRFRCWKTSSTAFSAEISVSSPRKLFIFSIWNNILWIKVSKMYFIYFWKQAALLWRQVCKRQFISADSCKLAICKTGVPLTPTWLSRRIVSSRWQSRSSMARSEVLLDT